METYRAGEIVLLTFPFADAMGASGVLPLYFWTQAMRILLLLG
jgi:hypothetical protein